MPDANDRSGKLTLYLDEARWRRDDQIGRVRSLDRKLATMFALNAAAIALFAAVLSFSLREASVPPAVIGLSLAALVIFVFNIVLLRLAYRASEWARRPDLPTLKAHIDRYGEEVMISWVADEINREIVANEEKVSRKAALVTRSISLSLLTIALLVVAAVVQWLT